MLRDQAVVELNINNEQVLRRQLEATNDQFRVGSVTRTDVAQAEARLAAARSSRQQAEGNLAVSRANYARFVGHPPGTSPARASSGDAGDARQALSLAATKNPNVIAALFTEDAARSTVVATRAQLLPSLNLVGDVNRGQETITNGRETTTGSVVLRVTMPLYEGGQIYSQTRQAQEKVAQSSGLTDDARRQAVQSATQAWETIQSARASAYSLQSTIRADQIALEGVRQEQQVGARTILDVLNQQQELFTDQVSLVQAQHDLAVAEFNLAQQIGTLTAVNLGLPVKLYDVDGITSRCATNGSASAPRTKAIALSGWPFRTASPSLWRRSESGCVPWRTPKTSTNRRWRRFSPPSAASSPRTVSLRTATRARPRPERRRRQRRTTTFSN